jgi:exopolyphosphatase/guanosine-5'-triphosphate,3'-diphosphate pyrophosphatase
MQATEAAVLALRDQALALGAASIRAVGTSALREAADGRLFASRLAARTGLDVEILPSQEEARLSYAGATGTLPLPGDALVFDLGGGSCELIWPEDGKLRLESLKIGAVYITETWFDHDPPEPAQTEKARRYVRGLIDRFNPGPKPVCGLGGTVTNLAAMAQGLDRYDPARVHGYTLLLSAVNRLFAAMVAVPADARRKLAGIQPERADILPAGALVAAEIMRSCRVRGITVSEGDLLAGCLLFH